jgi:hypothetical protein
VREAKKRGNSVVELAIWRKDNCIIEQNGEQSHFTMVTLTCLLVLAESDFCGSRHEIPFGASAGTILLERMIAKFLPSQERRETQSSHLGEK